LKQITRYCVVAAILLSSDMAAASPSDMLGKTAATISGNVNAPPSPGADTSSPTSFPPFPLASDESPIVDEIKASEPTPEEILQIKKIWQDVNNAKGRPIGDQPRPVITTVSIDLSPGSTPPVVRVSNQTGSIMVFLDATGKEWPIAHVVNMSQDTIDAQDKPIEGSAGNSLFAKIKRYGASGNIGVFLKDLSTPIIITMLSGQKDVDYRVDFRVPARIRPSTSDQPGAVAAVSKTEWDDRLSNALMAITPAGCKAQNTSSPDVMVWACEKSQSIIRSKGVLLSPAPLNGRKLVASDSTKAYLIPSSPVLSMLMNGITASIRVTNKD
jgi:intracellular multiplication protein IcmK